MNLQLKTTWQHIRRNPYQSLVAVVIVTLSFFMGFLFAYLTLSSDRVLSHIDQRPEIIVFFNDTITSADQITDLKTKLVQTGKTTKIRFVSKEEALKLYQEKNKNDPLLLELVTAKILPASLEIGPQTASDLPKLYELVKSYPNVDEVSYQQEIVQNIIIIIREIRRFGIGLIAFLAITTILIVLTIVGIKISGRKEEIEVERLLGASNWYIRWPFMQEGIFYGIVGSVFAWGLMGISMRFLIPSLTYYIANLNLLPPILTNQFSVLGVAIGIGIVLGSIGSLAAVHRYLRN